jgi:hypothetical protein
MECRLIHLQNTFLGYIKTGIPLIEWNGSQLIPTFSADDIGIYIIIPKLAHLLQISIETAISLFFYSLLLIPACIGMIGFLKYYKALPQKVIACIIILLLCRKAYSVGDVYLTYYACTVAVIPWALYFAQRQKTDFIFYFHMFMIGLYAGFLQFIRAYSSLGIILFSALLYALHMPSCSTWKSRSLLLVMLGLSIPYAYFSYQYNCSVHYMNNNTNIAHIGDNKHVFWHNIYLGFGLLKPGNSDNITYDDAYAFNKAQQVNNNLVLHDTKEYEAVIKQEVLNLLQHNIRFVLFTIFAKIGIMLLYLLQYANIGLIAAYLYRKSWKIELPFFICALYYMLFPILTMPTVTEYVLGFISCATLYGLVSINHVLEYFAVYKRGILARASKSAVA